MPLKNSGLSGGMRLKNHTQEAVGLSVTLESPTATRCLAPGDRPRRSLALDLIESPAACWIPSVRGPNGVHFSGLVQLKGSGVNREARWFICRNCGLLESTPDRYFNIVR